MSLHLYAECKTSFVDISFPQKEDISLNDVVERELKEKSPTTDIVIARDLKSAKSKSCTGVKRLFDLPISCFFTVTKNDNPKELHVVVVVVVVSVGAFDAFGALLLFGPFDAFGALLLFGPFVAFGALLLPVFGSLVALGTLDDLTSFKYLSCASAFVIDCTRSPFIHAIV